MPNDSDTNPPSMPPSQVGKQTLPISEFPTAEYQVSIDGRNWAEPGSLPEGKIGYWALSNERGETKLYRVHRERDRFSEATPEDINLLLLQRKSTTGSMPRIPIQSSGPHPVPSPLGSAERRPEDLEQKLESPQREKRPTQPMYSTIDGQPMLPPPPSLSEQPTSPDEPFELTSHSDESMEIHLDNAFAEMEHGSTPSPDQDFNTPQVSLEEQSAPSESLLGNKSQVNKGIEDMFAKLTPPPVVTDHTDPRPDPFAVGVDSSPTSAEHDMAYEDTLAGTPLSSAVALETSQDTPLTHVPQISVDEAEETQDLSVSDILPSSPDTDIPPPIAHESEEVGADALTAQGEQNIDGIDNLDNLVFGKDDTPLPAPIPSPTPQTLADLGEDVPLRYDSGLHHLQRILDEGHSVMIRHQGLRHQVRREGLPLGKTFHFVQADGRNLEARIVRDGEHLQVKYIRKTPPPTPIQAIDPTLGYQAEIGLSGLLEVMQRGERLTLINGSNQIPVSMVELEYDQVYTARFTRGEDTIERNFKIIRREGKNHLEQVVDSSTPPLVSSMPGSMPQIPSWYINLLAQEGYRKVGKKTLKIGTADPSVRTSMLQDKLLEVEYNGRSIQLKKQDLLVGHRLSFQGHTLYIEQSNGGLVLVDYDGDKHSPQARQRALEDRLAQLERPKEIPNTKDVADLKQRLTRLEEPTPSTRYEAYFLGEGKYAIAPQQVGSARTEHAPNFLKLPLETLIKEIKGDEEAWYCIVNNDGTKELQPLSEEQKAVRAFRHEEEIGLIQRDRHKSQVRKTAGITAAIVLALGALGFGGYKYFTQIAQQAGENQAREQKVRVLEIDGVEYFSREVELDNGDIVRIVDANKDGKYDPRQDPVESAFIDKHPLSPLSEQNLKHAKRKIELLKLEQAQMQATHAQRSINHDQVIQYNLQQDELEKKISQFQQRLVDAKDQQEVQAIEQQLGEYWLASQEEKRADLHQEQRAMQQRLGGLETQLDERQDQLTTLEKKEKEVTSLYQKRLNTIKSIYNKAFTKLEKIREAAHNRINTANKFFSRAEARAKKLENRVGSADEKSREVAGVITRQTQRYEGHQRTLEQAETSLHTKRKSLGLEVAAGLAATSQARRTIQETIPKAKQLKKQADLARTHAKAHEDETIQYLPTARQRTTELGDLLSSARGYKAEFDPLYQGLKSQDAKARDIITTLNEKYQLTQQAREKLEEIQQVLQTLPDPKTTLTDAQSRLNAYTKAKVIFEQVRGLQAQLPAPAADNLADVAKFAYSLRQSTLQATLASPQSYIIRFLEQADAQTTQDLLHFKETKECPKGATTSLRKDKVSCFDGFYMSAAPDQESFALQLYTHLTAQQTMPDLVKDNLLVSIGSGTNPRGTILYWLKK